MKDPMSSDATVSVLTQSSNLTWPNRKPSRFWKVQVSVELDHGPVESEDGVFAERFEPVRTELYSGAKKLGSAQLPPSGGKRLMRGARRPFLLRD